MRMKTLKIIALIDKSPETKAFIDKFEKEVIDPYFERRKFLEKQLADLDKSQKANHDACQARLMEIAKAEGNLPADFTLGENELLSVNQKLGTIEHRLMVNDPFGDLIAGIL